MTLPRKNRLPLRGRVLGGTSVYHYPLFKLLWSPNEGKRFAFVVSKRLSKKAVVRNKVRRRLSEMIRELLPSIKGGDYLFSVKKEIVEKKNQEVKEMLRTCLRKEGFLK